MTRRLTAGLVAFHGVLLWQRCADATILEPAVLAKYLAAVLLLAAAAAFKRLAPPHLRGRRALLVFWLVVLLFHAGAPFSTDTRDLEGEIVAIVEIGLVLPLGLALARSAVATVPSLRALHLVATADIAVAFASERIQLPARAPPCFS